MSDYIPLTDRPAQTIEQRRQIVQEVDGIMAVNGFAKTMHMAALDDAYILGRIALDQKQDFLLLEARITGTKSVLASIGQDDARFTGLRQRCEADQEEYGRLSRAWDLAEVSALSLVCSPSKPL